MLVKTNVHSCVQTLSAVSPSLASLVKLHEPQFVRFEGHSVDYDRHLAGLSASGVEVNPCLVRLGANGARLLVNACRAELMDCSSAI